jgi:D-proline reductase (dithiol) PrdB
VGLIQRAIEAEGVPTISISLNKRITEKVRPPRALLVDFPLGHPMGNPFDYGVQRKILVEALMYLQVIVDPGTILDRTKSYRIKRGKCTVCEVK